MAISAADTPHGGERWRSHRLAALTLRAGIVLAPMAAAIVASLWVSRQLYEPSSAPQVVLWWVILIASSSAVAWAVDRFVRRLLPLAVMLKATMLFPDQAPSRYRVALRGSNVTELRRRIAEHTSSDTADLSTAASLTLSLASALNDHDRRTRGHGERTRAYSDMLAEELKVPEEGRDKLRWAALLHDIGKLEVPSDVLNKDGPLTADEMAAIHRHPLNGMRVAAAIVPWLGEWAGAIEHHHERWDGTGYPRGLAGTEISLAARIVAVADSYDVMTSGRSYQPAISPAAAREELARMAGTQFDPTVVRAFMNISLGRLRSLAPVASLGPIPFLLDRIGRDFLTVSTAATVTAAAVVAGAVPVPARQIPPPIVASVDTHLPTEQAPPGDTDGPSATAPAATPPGEETTAPGDTTTTTAPPESTTTEPPSTTAPPTTSPPSTDPPTTEPPGPPTTTPPSTSPPTSSPPATAPPTTLPPAPQANPDVASTIEDRPVSIPVLENDRPKGLALSLISQPSSGTATLDGTNVRYTPTPNTNGTDTFGYRVCDAWDRCAETTVAVNVSPVNDPPTIVDDSAATTSSTPINIDVLANDSDVDGDKLSIRSVTAPAHGKTSINGSQVTYQPAQGFIGVDSFKYTACDPSGECGTATVTVTVTGSPPRAKDDSARTNGGGGVWIRVLANDYDPDGNLDQSTLSVVRPPDHGTFRINRNRIRYFADRRFRGTDSFDYRICDTTGLCATATVTVTVR